MAHVREIWMKGFKSFGVNKVVIPLARGLNVIVGENGHGKSNITEAIVFAFGGRSTAMMRAERFQDFLYMRDGRIIAPYAEVTLVIDNSDGGLPLMSKTVEISRRVDRSGKCVFKINGKRVDRQEIVDLLSPVFGSPDGMNFIMQDQVDRIFSRTPEERLAIIEDLAGIKEYNERREKAANELSKVESNMSVLSSRIELFRGTVESLRKDAQDYLAAKSIDRELQQVRAAILFKELKQKEKKLKLLESRLRALSRNNKDYQEKLDQIKRKEEELEKEKNLISSKLRGMEEKGIIASFRQVEVEARTLERNLSEISEKKRKVEEELKRLKEAIDEQTGKLVSEIQALREMHLKFRQQLSELSSTADPTRAGEILKDVSALLRRVDETLSSIIAELPSINERSSSLVSRALELQGELSAYAKEENRLRRAVEEKVKKLESMRSGKERAEKAIARLGERLKKIEERLRILKGRGEEIQNRRVNDARRHASLEGEKSQLSKEISELREKLAEMSVDCKHLLAKKLETLKKMEAELSARRSQLGEVNPKALESLQKEEEKLREEEEKYRKLEEEKQQILSFIAEIDQKKKDAFFKVFNVVSQAFSEIFRELTQGFNGRLVLTNPENPFEGGLDFDVDFGEKTRMLSGGQKSLTAIAFILALQRCRPSTFYVMDEIDKNLDPFNRQRVAQLLKKFSRESQMIVVTLHTSLAEVADRIFGVVKENKVSRIFSADLSMLKGGIGDGSQ